MNAQLPRDLRRGLGRSHPVLATERLIEAPNWHPDGWLLVNGEGRLFRVPLDAPDLLAVETGTAVRCNNDHGISPDGGTIILSSHHRAGVGDLRHAGGGGRAAVVSPKAPSWWHGVSPDGGRIVYVAARGNRVIDVWSCPSVGRRGDGG